MTKKKVTFEQALARLEDIAEQIEQGKIGLEESHRQVRRRNGPGATLSRGSRQSRAANP